MKFKVISYIYNNMPGDHHIKPALDTEKSGSTNIGTCNKLINVFDTYSEALIFHEKCAIGTQCC